MVLSIDAQRRTDSAAPWWEVVLDGGRTPTGLDAIQVAERGVKLGAGEIVMNSIDADGTREGYDLDLLRTVSDAVPVPVVASGGAGSIEHIRDALVDGRAHAALAASIFHFKLISIERVKRGARGGGAAHAHGSLCGGGRLTDRLGSRLA